MDNEKIIEILNRDLQDEHGAIIQYLTHAYSMGEGELSCEIEAFAREEMRHLDWLAETIVELGGEPSLKRGTMNMSGKTPTEWMADDVKLEQGAIDNYTEHIKLIDDPKIKRLLKRILADEMAHRGKFEHFVEKAGREGLKDERGDRKDGVTDTYMTGNAEAKKQLEDQAINEMQHLGWLAEEMVDGGGSPKMEHTEPDQSISTADMLKADLKIEKEVADAYDKASKEVDDAGLKQLLIRIRDNEKYHIDVFNDVLKEEEGDKGISGIVNIPDSGV
jgi:bacterioferritin